MIFGFGKNKAVQRVNLIPIEMRPSVVNYHSVSRILIFTFLIAPLLGGGVKLIKFHKLAEMEQLTQQRDELSRQIQNQIRLREAGSEHRAMQAIQKAISDKVYWAMIFKEMSTLFPKTIWLTNFETKAGPDAKHLVITGNSSSQADITEFFSRLESSYYFRDIKIKYSEINDGKEPKLFQFQFEGNIFEPGTAKGKDG